MPEKTFRPAFSPIFRPKNKAFFADFKDNGGSGLEDLIPP